MTSPALEITLSDGTEVAEMQRYFLEGSKSAGFLHLSSFFAWSRGTLSLVRSGRANNSLIASAEFAILSPGGT